MPLGDTAGTVHSLSVYGIPDTGLDPEHQMDRRPPGFSAHPDSQAEDEQAVGRGQVPSGVTFTPSNLGG